ncbi:hypothetical protein JOC86_003599 [Bacillus pakistanensis]|uniref:DUF4129 domain-containing protein n=1 Tax=Rossellomorea pakistanensis TaxID=992288 RepID=A0ABS2NGQ8_9BACI|nr:hypothetical protein [Bacillus pakistanensis]MBM7587047.1 hypothetical protein [Bacillus pakistanensis]
MEADLVKTYPKEKTLLSLKRMLLLFNDFLFILIGLTILLANQELMMEYLPFLTFAYVGLALTCVVTVFSTKVTFTTIPTFLLLAGAGYILSDMKTWILLLILIILFGRVQGYKEDSEVYYEMGSGYFLLFLLLAAASLLVGSITDFGNSRLIYSVIFIQLILLIAGTFLLRIIQFGSINKNRSTFPYLIGASILPFIFGGVVWFLIPHVKNVGIFLFSKILGVVSFAVNPIMGLLSSILPEEYVKKAFGIDDKNDKTLEVSQSDIEIHEKAFYESVSFPYVQVFLIIVVLAAGIYFFRKRNRGSGPEPKNSVANSTSNIVVGLKEASPQKAYIYSSSAGKIRTAVAELEKASKQYGKERKDAETIREWLHRLTIEQSTIFYSMYESTRYGQKNYSAEETEWFVHAVNKIIKDWLK